MMRTFAYIGIVVLIAGAALEVSGQSGDSAPKFEIADVRPSPAPGPGSQNQFMRGGFYRGGRYEVRTATMVDLIRTAYAVDPDKVTGGPGWMETDRFDVIAKAPADAKPETLQLMLRSLLADRFGLVVHNDTKPLAAYAIRPGKAVKMKQADGTGDTGCKLVPQSPPAAGAGAGRVMVNMNGVQLVLGAGSYIVYSCRNVTMPALGDEIGNMVLARQYLTNNHVVDETELKGAWNFDLRYSPKLPFGLIGGSGETDDITLFDAFDKQLGLKLEPTKVPMSVIAVDSVNEKPTDNLPGVTEKMPPQPTEFEVADIKPSDPNPTPGGRGGCLFCPGGRVNLTNETMSGLISLAWNLNGNPANRIVGLPKSLDTQRWDIVAKAATMTSINVPLNGQPPPQTVDFDSMRIMLKALLKDRFKLVIHEEQRPLPGYALVAVKPKMKTADPSNRPACNEGPGPDGKDPRVNNPALGRLMSCQNMTMAEFAALLPNRVGGYFLQYPGGVVDATKLDGAYDFTLSFSYPGVIGGAGRGGGGRGGADGGEAAAGGGAGEASDPGGGLTLQDAIEKQLGLRLEPQKNQGTVLVVDHVEEKPTDN